MTYNWDAVNEAIRVERARLKWSREDLANRIGMSVNTVKNLEGQHTYKRMPVEAFRAIDKAFGWTEGTLERKLTAPPGSTGAQPTPAESDLEQLYRRDPVSEGDLVGLIHNVVYETVIATAPDTPLSKVREIEERALEVARRAGFGPPHRRQQTHSEDDPEP